MTKEDEYKYTHMERESKNALAFKDRAKLVSKEFVPEEEGYYILEDGTVVISTAVELNNINGENLDWWMIWHQLDPLRYAIWNPEDHYDIQISEETRARFLDDTIPLNERIWGQHSFVNESMNGEKPEIIDIGFVNTREHGYESADYGSDACMAMVASNGQIELGPIKIPLFMTEIVRKTPDGKTKWLGHWWIGHSHKDGEDQYKKIPLLLRKKVAQNAAMLILHNHKEVGHLDKFIAELYEENKDNWLE